MHEALRTPSRPRRTVSVCLPARDEAPTITAMVRMCVDLRDAGVVDEVVVVDESSDGTASLAARAGARVHRQSELMPEYGPVAGKGDAMWRALSVLTGDIVVFLDADTTDPAPRLVTGLLAPMQHDAQVRFVKGRYRRPFTSAGGHVTPHGGGRVTELTARPLLRRCFPELAAIRQPLAGEIAVDRDLLCALPFHLDYAVDVGLLIDAWRTCGADALAQGDLGVRRNRHQPLDALHVMACAVTDAILDRAAGEGAAAAPMRPPMAALATAEVAA